MCASVTSRSPVAAFSARIEIVDQELVLGELELGRRFRGGRLLLLERAADCRQQIRHNFLRRGRQQNVAGRQGLIVHVPAAVDAEVVAHHDHLGAWDAVRKTDLEGAGGIDPVEAEDHIGFAQGFLGIGSEH